MARPVVILFARAPRLGTVKRRLAAGLGPVAALRFHRNTLAATLRKLDRLAGWDKIIAVTPRRARLRHPPGWRVIGQTHGDLGRRMADAFRRFPRRRVVLVGADIPELGPSDLRSAARHLRHADAVFGPAADGGYYLVGMAARRPAHPFAQVRWSSPHALTDTLKNFASLSIARLRTLQDVDTAADLARLSARKYLRAWALTPDGAPLVTATSLLLPVRRGPRPAMLKIAGTAEERAGANLMRWWAGKGAARVLAADGPALLLERARDPTALTEMVQNGNDDAATRIICNTIRQLHTPRPAPAPDLVALSIWFRALHATANNHGGLLAAAAATASSLLHDPRQVTVLHGDIHHGNILHFGRRGWLAIDPKALHGECGFDYANLFCNPNHAAATAPGRLQRRVEIVAELTGLPPRRMLQWVLAWSGLSAAWSMTEGASPATALAIAAIAAAELDAGVP
jgi:streptomycin 6-kinase